MAQGFIGVLKSSLPAPVWKQVRNAGYRVLSWRHATGYLPGLMFDIFRGSYRTEGMRFEVPKHLTTRIHRARFWHDTHERDERDLVNKYLPADACVLELGACLGVVSCVINRRLANGRQQVAVEANPALAQALNANRDANGCGFGIEICMVSRSSDGTFFQNDCMVMSSGHMRQGTEIRVPVCSTDELEQKYQLRFDTVFMDIQGGELEFLRENPALLARCRLVILEVHPHIIGPDACEQCRELMRAAGLQLAERRGLVEVWSRGALTKTQ